MNQQSQIAFWRLFLAIVLCYVVFNSWVNHNKALIRIRPSTLQAKSKGSRKEGSLMLDDLEKFPQKAKESQCDLREKEYEKQYGEDFETLHTVNSVVKGRLQQKNSWEKASCERWQLHGDWTTQPTRKIYYAFHLSHEMEVLEVLLEEIFPVVDHIIIQESAHSLTTGKPKPLYFQKYFHQHFSKYANKTRYLEYSFSSMPECDPGSASASGTSSSSSSSWPVHCKEAQTWHSRNNLEKGASDISSSDVFLVADVDEVVSRRFLEALHHCQIHLPDQRSQQLDSPPEATKDHPACAKATLLTFGHIYNMECTTQRPAGHFHPDMTLGRCLHLMGPEEIRTFYDWRNHPNKSNYTKRYRPADVQCEKHVDEQRNVALQPCHRLGTQKGIVLGPVGWHLMEFQSSYEIMQDREEVAGRFGSLARWDQKELKFIQLQKRLCKFYNPQPVPLFKIDALGCIPLPHAFKRDPAKWRHFLQHEEDDRYPDPFGFQANIKKEALEG